MTDYEIELLASLRLLVGEVEGERRPQSPDIVSALAAVKFHLGKGPRLAPENFAAAPALPAAAQPADEREQFEAWAKQSPTPYDLRESKYIGNGIRTYHQDRTQWAFESFCGALRMRPAAAQEPESQPAAPFDGVHWHLLPGWLIDHCEGDTITEEGLQFAVADMLKSDEYKQAVAALQAPVPAAQEGVAAKIRTWQERITDANAARSFFPLHVPSVKESMMEAEIADLRAALAAAPAAAPIVQPVADERAKFEAWHAKHYGRATHRAKPEHGGSQAGIEYWGDDTNDSRAGWLAALSSAPMAQVEPAAPSERGVANAARRIDEAQAIIREGSYWDGNEQRFAIKNESAVTELDDILSDAARCLHAAPTSSTAAAKDAVRLLNDEEMAALRRFAETCEDDESYDVPKEKMRRLAAIGVIESKGFRRYQITDFGDFVLDRAAIASSAGEVKP